MKIPHPPVKLIDLVGQQLERRGWSRTKLRDELVNRHGNGIDALSIDSVHSWFQRRRISSRCREAVADLLGIDIAPRLKQAS